MSLGERKSIVIYKLSGNFWNVENITAAEKAKKCVPRRMKCSLTILGAVITTDVVCRGV